MRGLVILALLALSGCAANLTGANERGGIISHANAVNADTAFKLADDHCHKFNRVARISGTDVIYNTMTFDCVAP